MLVERELMPEFIPVKRQVFRNQRIDFFLLYFEAWSKQLELEELEQVLQLQLLSSGLKV